MLNVNSQETETLTDLNHVLQICKVESYKVVDKSINLARGGSVTMGLPHLVYSSVHFSIVE